MRIERDALGQMELPDEAYYGIQTMRAADNFAVSGVTCSKYTEYITSLVGIKKAAALAHGDMDLLSKDVVRAIVSACDEIMGGALLDEFIVDVIQGGGSTSTNQNANEVIANRANEILTGKKGNDKVRPNDHVNLGQSTNDVIFTALKIGIYRAFENLIKESERLSKTMRDKQSEFKDVVKLGRTCMQDALPTTLGHEFGGFASMIERQTEKLRVVRKEFLSLPLGATAVGTGLCAFEGYDEGVYEHMRQIFGADFYQDSDLFDGIQNADVYVSASGGLKSLAVGLGKIAADFRMLSSGPQTGLCEITLPAVQPGSTCMPRKINPVMPELMVQISWQVCGNDTAVTMAAQGGELDCNVWEPIFIKNIFDSMGLLTKGIALFNDKCVKGIQANADVCKKNAEQGYGLPMVLSSVFGYQAGLEAGLDMFDENEQRLLTDSSVLADKKQNRKMTLDMRRKRS